MSERNINVGVRTRWFDLGTGRERVKMRRAMLNWYFPKLRRGLRAQGFDVKAPATQRTPDDHTRQKQRSAARI